MEIRRRLLPTFALAFTLLFARPLAAATLVVNAGAAVTLTTDALLARPDVKTITVPDDVSFHRAMTYRAVPLRALPGIAGLPAGTDLRIAARDGFVTTLPAALVFDAAPHAAVPWLAIEPATAPWPRTPTGEAVGPFYLVWQNASASGVRSEQWPFQVASISAVAAQARAWPQLAIGRDVPARAPVRRGGALFATQCMVCHRMNGAGDATLGPDLNLPRNPTEYLQPWALKALIRDPRSLRAWPDMKMHGFDRASLSDADLDAVVDYLRYMAARRGR